MGLSVGNSIYSANSVRPAIDSQALVRVSEQILNPQNQPTIDVSKLDLSKFNRVQLGTDLYAEKTNAQMALQAAKAVTDFDVKLSNGFSANVQYFFLKTKSGLSFLHFPRLPFSRLPVAQFFVSPLSVLLELIIKGVAFD